MKIFQQESPSKHGTTLLEGVVDCLMQAGAEPPDIFAELAEVAIRTARRDPPHAVQHLEALTAILTEAANETTPANDVRQTALLQGA
jgi:hypothetical protein